MKFLVKSYPLILLLLVNSIAFSQHVEERALPPFKALKAGEAIEVYLKKGDDEQVRIETEGVDIEKVITDVSGQTLKIYMERGNYKNRKVKAYVTFKSLEEINCNSAADIQGESIIEGDHLRINVNSAANVRLEVKVNGLDIKVTSSGELNISGSAKRTNVDISSAGDLNAYNLISEHTTINVSSGGVAKVTASKELNAKANSGGNIRYKGNPDKKNIHSNSGGSVSKAR